MKKRLILLLLPFLALACTPQDDKPADVLSEDAMTRLLLDVHLTEAKVNRTYLHPDSSRLAYKAVHKDLLKKHNVTDSTFQHSYDYYMKHPEQMDHIYERILDSLSLKEAKLTGQKAKPTEVLVEEVTELKNSRQ